MATAVRGVDDWVAEGRLRIEVHRARHVTLGERLVRATVDDERPHRAPRAATARGTTSWSGNRGRSSSTRGATDPPQTTTLGPEPESVAPRAPTGSAARRLSRTAEGL